MTGQLSDIDDWEVQIDKQPWESSDCDQSQESAEDAVVQTETDRQIHQLMPKVAKSIAQMDVTHPEVLRTARAHQAFQNFAAALRIGSDGDFYYKSRKSHKISTFWSHSWHGGHWKKILTLISFYNGTAASSFGLLTGVLMMLLFCFGQLPGFSRGESEVIWSTWSLCSGVLVTCLVAIFWRPQTQVFFDRICISQADNELKAQAIFSLAGLLKSSDQMLILWDPTWTQRLFEVLEVIWLDFHLQKFTIWGICQRFLVHGKHLQQIQGLWCLFELAAFLQSRKTRKQALIVRPVFLGPISIGIFLTMSILAMPGTLVPIQKRVFIPAGAVLLLGMIAAYPAVSTLRNYFRDLDVMKQQLLSISFDTTKSSCCDQDHVDPKGQTMLCDRRIVKECVDIWFGSQQAFEDTVRSEVLSILDRELTEKVFSTAWVLGVTSPIMLLFMDLTASLVPVPVRKQNRAFLQNPASVLIIQGLVLWLFALPAVKDLLICFCRLLRRKPRNFWLEALKNTLTLLLVVCPLFMMLALFGLAHSGYFGKMRIRNAAFVAGILILSVCNCLLAAILKALLKRPAW